MEKIQLKTVARDVDQKRDSKHLQREGLIPGELYGHNIPNVHVSLNQIEFEKVLRKAGESTIIELQLPDGSARNVLIQDVTKHYLNSQPIHVDFYEVKMTEKLTATIPLEFIGESHAVKALGGTLVKVVNEVEVECLPGDLPHVIEVDITPLKSFDIVLTVADLKVSHKVTLKVDQEETVATVQPPRDVEAELAQPVGDIDVSQVEGVADKEPEASEATEEK